MKSHSQLNHESNGVQQELDLENLVKKYLIGEIELEDYKAKLARLDPQLNLRKIAAKINTGSLEGKLPR